jgi:hypothetical protein
MEAWAILTQAARVKYLPFQLGENVGFVSSRTSIFGTTTIREIRKRDKFTMLDSVAVEADRDYFYSLLTCP